MRKHLVYGAAGVLLVASASANAALGRNDLFIAVVDTDASNGGAARSSIVIDTNILAADFLANPLGFLGTTFDAGSALGSFLGNPNVDVADLTLGVFGEVNQTSHLSTSAPGTPLGNISFAPGFAGFQAAAARVDNFISNVNSAIGGADSVTALPGQSAFAGVFGSPGGWGNDYDNGIVGWSTVGGANQLVPFFGLTLDFGDFSSTVVNPLGSGAGWLLDTAAGAVCYTDGSSCGSTVVPVPAAVWLFGSALLGLAGVSRRRS